MAPRTVRSGGLRRRLAIAFVLTVGASSAALAAGSYLVVRHNLLRDSVDAGEAQARRNLLVAPTYLGQGTGALLRAYERGGDFLTVGLDRATPFSSSFSVGLRQVPDELRRIAARGEMGYARATVAGVPYLIVGGPAGSGRELWFFFSEQALHRELDQLRAILLGGVAILMLIAAVVGSLLAQSTLRPVRRASAAARSLAEGLLETRLPVTDRDEFGAWAEAFNEMAAALDAKIRDLSAARARERRFTADVAHELRTPLSALVAEASLLAEHLDAMPPAARRPAELLIADVARLRRLVEDLLEIARFDAGRENVQREPVDLAALAAAALRARGWDDRVALEADPTTIASDPRRLERILVNLVENAIDHGGATVVVRIAADAGAALVEVADDGPGIAAEDLPHVFERFWKADAARTGRGTGIGLAIALENARLLGGDITVASEAGAGTRFVVRLPGAAVAEPLRGGDPGVARDEEGDLRHAEGRLR